MRVIGEIGGRKAGVAVLAAACLLPLDAAVSNVFAACFPTGKTGVTVEAVAARDGTTVLLRDGRELRLSGIAAPIAEEAAETARQALERVAAGRELLVYAAVPDTDRYGRLTGVARLADPAGGSLQEHLVEAGFAQVFPALGSAACMRALLRLEARARAARRGFWANGHFAVLDPRDLPAALVADGAFAVIEAAVQRVGEAGGRLYVDFGPRYREDFTIVIPREAHGAFSKAGVDLRALSGRRVRARGVLFFSGGPAMELRDPAALELVEAGGHASH